MKLTNEFNYLVRTLYVRNKGVLNNGVDYKIKS